jgi:hypothetical protein
MNQMSKFYYLLNLIHLEGTDGPEMTLRYNLQSNDKIQGNSNSYYVETDKSKL